MIFQINITTRFQSIILQFRNKKVAIYPYESATIVFT